VVQAAAAYGDRVRRAAAILVVVGLVGVLTAAASGSASRVVKLPLHGTVILAGSDIRCGSGRLAGKTYVDCGVSDDRGQPKRGGFVALLDASGRVTVYDVTAKKAVLARVPASVGQAPVGTRIRADDVVHLPGTSISCNASTVSGKPAIFCYYVDKDGVVRPNSYSFGISDTVLTVLSWNRARKAKLVNSWAENG
jgi:hypothetical protein